MTTPKQEGRYLLCVFEWVGLYANKPKEPRWELRDFSLSKGWQRERYTFDTGGYTNFEPVAWQDLPPLPLLTAKAAQPEGEKP